MVSLAPLTTAPYTSTQVGSRCLSPLAGSQLSDSNHLGIINRTLMGAPVFSIIHLWVWEGSRSYAHL